MANTVIEWDRNRLIVARGHVAGQATDFQSVHVISRESGAAESGTLTDRLRQVIPSSGKAPIAVSLVLPRQQVTFHRIELPNIGDDEIPDMIRLQATMRLTVPIDTVCLDFAPLPVVAGSATREVLLVTTSLDSVNEIRRMLAACQIELSDVRVSSFCIAAAAVQAGLLRASAEPNVVDILVLMRSDVIETTFVQGTSVVYAHSGASWSSPEGVEKAVRSELNRARLAAAEDLGEYQIGRLLLIGRSEFTKAVSDQVSGRMNVAAIERVDPLAGMITGSLPAEVGADELVAAAGAIIATSSRQVESVDLINPRRAREKRDLRRVKILGAALAAILVIGLAWNWRQNQLSEIQDELVLLESDMDDIRSTLRRGAPERALADLVGHWVNRDINWLDEMTRLNELLPGTERILIRNFHFLTKQADGIGTIQIDGTAKTREDVESLARRLDAAGYLVTPYKPGVARISGPYPVGITLQLTIPDRPPRNHNDG